MKNLAKVFIVIILISLLSVSCDSLNISSDYDKKVDFRAFKTYSLSQSIQDLRLNSDDKEIMKNAITNQMNTRGYQITNSISPDLWVDVFIKYDRSGGTTETNDIYGIRIYPYGVDFSTSYIDYHSFASGTLIIDIIDSKKNLLVWQGRITKDIKLNQTDIAKEELIKNAVKKIFEAFPVKVP